MDLNKVTAPLPGNIWQVQVEIGSEVKEGDSVVILEAMKMENEIIAEKDGVVKAIFVKKGDAVGAGDILVELE
jgi:biotin carboxyl carrier protein